MYQHVMCAFDFPIGVPKVLTRTGVGVQDHNFIPLEQLFGLQKCTVVPPKHLYHGVLPERDPVSNKVTFPLTPMTGTWTSVELQLAVSVGYEIQECIHNTTSNNKALLCSGITLLRSLISRKRLPKTET